MLWLGFEPILCGLKHQSLGPASLTARLRHATSWDTTRLKRDLHMVPPQNVTWRVTYYFTRETIVAILTRLNLTTYIFIMVEKRKFALWLLLIIHILTGNEVTSVRLLPRGTLSGQKRHLFPEAEYTSYRIMPVNMCFITHLGLKCEIRT